jgi:hypothetical protein
MNHSSIALMRMTNEETSPTVGHRLSPYSGYEYNSVRPRKSYKDSGLWPIDQDL